MLPTESGTRTHPLKQALARATRSGFDCRCCGNPTIEFYSSQELVASLGVHHGLSLRWADGSWNGDSLLTDESAEFACRWLAKRGVRGPQEERESELAASRAATARSRAYELLIEEPLLTALKQAEDGVAGARAFAVHLPDEADRARLCLRLFGVDAASWNVTAGIDPLLADRVIPGLQARQILAVVVAVLPSLGRWGLTHPRAVNRRRTFEALTEIGGSEAVSLLRGVLAGTIVARSPEGGMSADPGGMVTFMPGDAAFPEEFDDVVCAGLALGRLGDADSRARIRDLAERSPDRERAALELALKGPRSG